MSLKPSHNKNSVYGYILNFCVYFVNIGEQVFYFVPATAIKPCFQCTIASINDQLIPVFLNSSPD